MSTRARKSAPPAITARLRSPGAVLGPRGNRAIAKILSATRQIFLVRGYGGTTIDDIANEAGVSRASFYTYFPTKRDVLLALGADALTDAAKIIDELGALPAKWSVDDIDGWVANYFAMLDEYGSFSFAWTQAAHEDEELRVAGMRGHLSLCRRLGEALVSLGAPAEGAVERGLLVFSMLERAWSYLQLYGAGVDQAAVRRSVAEMLAAIAR